MNGRKRTVTTDGNAIITDQGRLITTNWRDISTGSGRCRAYQGYTWVILPRRQGFIAQLSGNGVPASRRYFRNQADALRWLRSQSADHPA